MADVVKVENVVASTSLGMKFDLGLITEALENVEYEPEQFPGLVYRMKEPKVVLLLFGSGKIVCTGAKSVADAENAAKNVAEKLKELGLF